MDYREKWPKLADAVGLMQMDNGYCDEGGVRQALERAEAETAGYQVQGRTFCEITLAQLQAAEAWCAAQSPEDLDAACCGEDITAEGGMGMAMLGIDGDVVVVPEEVVVVLNYLFDNM